MPVSKATRARLTFAGSAAVALVGILVWRARPAPPLPPPERPSDAPTAHREAFVEIAVASPLDETQLAGWEERRALIGLLGTFAPGGPGEAGQFRAAAEALIRDERSLGIEVMSAERYILPSPEDAEQVAPHLSPEERARFFASKAVLVVRLRGAGGPPHWVARTGFGLAAALAEQTQGFVDDEVRRRVETFAMVKARMPPVDLRSVFADDAVSVEFDPDEGTTEHGRVLTLGMRRFGAPDFQLMGVSVQDAGAAARALTALCRVAAARSLDGDVALAPAELFDDPARQGAPVALHFTPADLATGNPENDFWTVGLDPAVRTSLLRELSFGTAPDAGLHAETDAEFQARLTAVRAALPGVVSRWTREKGTLQVLVDFPTDDGIESMWVKVERLDAESLRGTLENEPAHVAGLHHGSAVTVRDPVVSGYRLTLPSGQRLALP